MNRSYSKIRHIQEANERLEKRMLNEDNDNMFLKRRLSTIEELIDKNIEKVNDEGGYGFSDEFEFGSNIISWVVDELTNYDYDTYDYDELVDLIKDNFGEYILSQYVEEDFDDDEDFDDEDYDDEDDF
jgi:two-component sensor histidine kinase